MKNTIITGFFVCITIAQLGVGIHLTTLAANTPGMMPISVRSCSEWWLSILIALDRWELSATIPSYSLHGVPTMCLRQTPEGIDRLHSHLALLWFAFLGALFSLS